jgi:lipoprotein-anchoring transpeptidase ErfK/SrfK/peptidoglycan hydrolase-like protein with peptidoglycan-binding domain
MSVPPRKKAPARRRNSGGRFWFLVLLLVVIGGLVWYTWHEKHPSKRMRHRKALPVAGTFPPAQAAPASIPVPVPIPIPPPYAPPTNKAVPFPSPAGNLGPVPTTSPSTNEFPRPARNALEVQIALARRAISPGSIDGALGHQSRQALASFQRLQNLPDSGVLDTNTRSLLTLETPIITTYLVTSNDLAQLQPLGKTWLEKSQQTSMAFETELELVGEKAHSNPLLIKKLNPGINWTNLGPGIILQIPDVTYPDPPDKAAYAVIHLSERYLEAFDASTNLIAHFPCSIAAKVEKRPIGELHVIVIAPHPNYTVNPELFPESDELRILGHKLILPPGPNNPVGVAWIGLDRPGYGMHGTPKPEEVGRTESHGCFRLANWDAEYMVKLSWVGMPVLVEP